MRRAAGALARCARPLPRPVCGARALARSLSLHFFSPLPPSLSPLAPPRAPGCPRLRRALPFSSVGSTERCELWETATPSPARNLPPGPAPCPALPSARGSAKAPRTHRRLRNSDANTLAASPNSLPPHPAPPPPPAAAAEGPTLPPPPPSAGSGCDFCLDYYFIYFGSCTSLSACSPRLLGPRAPPPPAPEPQTPATLASTPPEPRQLPRVSVAGILLEAVFLGGSGFPTFLFSAKGRLS